MFCSRGPPGMVSRAHHLRLTWAPLVSPFASHLSRKRKKRKKKEPLLLMLSCLLSP